MINEVADLAQAIDGAHLSGMMPYLEAELRKMEEACVVRMDQLMVSGRLTPELAQIAWIELIGYRRLRRRLTQKVAIGVAAGTRQQTILNGMIGADNLPLPI